MSRPEVLLGDYDLVFAKARCALEALACGAAVILCDARGLGPLVTRAALPELRRLNFGMRTLVDPVDPQAVVQRIRRYDPLEAARASEQVRATAGLDSTVDRLLALYREVLALHRRAPPRAPDEAEAASGYVAGLGRLVRERELLPERCAALERQVEVLRNLRSVRLARRIRELAGRLLARRGSGPPGGPCTRRPAGG